MDDRHGPVDSEPATPGTSAAESPPPPLADLTVSSPLLPRLDAPVLAEAVTPGFVYARPVPLRARGLRALLGPVLFVLVVVLGTMFVYPLLAARWRSIDAQAEADAIYQRRWAELRAEADASAQWLEAADKRVQLVSLGFRAVVRKVAPSVVNVASYREAGAERPARGPLHIDPETERSYRQLGVGSGLLVRPGYVLTNHHVVRGAHRLRVTFASGQSVGLPLDANVLADPVTDLAILRLPPDLPQGLVDDAKVSVEFADSDRDVYPGDIVLALGSPLGLKQTVTHGIISAKGRLLDRITLVELLQTDAPINPGNSGGPLFDQFGRVVGVNVAIASDNGGSQGIGFTIPSNTVKKVFEQLVEKGEVARGYIGVAMDELTLAQVRELGLTKAGGVAVVRVMPGEAAARAGLRPGDVIVRYNRETLGAQYPMRQLRQLILETEVGREVPVEVVRDGEPRTLTVRIGKRPANLP